jgi:peptidoglycan/LPS O-acetylase OafA/YrhL
MHDKARKVSYLDGIRGLAAFLVLLHHLIMAFLPAVYTLAPTDAHWRAGWEVAYGKSILSALVNGNYAVCVFFVLSGYVLSRQYFLSERIETITSAASRRYIRLYVPVAVTLVLAYMLLKAGLFYNVPAGYVSHSGNWWSTFWITDHPEKMLFRGLLYSTMFQGDGFYDFSLWSISVELYGSMLVFAFLALTHHTRNRGLWLIILLAYFGFTKQYYYTAFLMGIALHFTKHWELRSSFWNFLLSTLLLVFSLTLGALPTGMAARVIDPAWLVHDEAIIFHVMGSVGLLISVLMSPRLQRFFSWRPMRFLGYISYSLYLLHVLVIGTLTSWMVLWLYPRIGYMRAVGLAFTASTLVTIAASYVMTIYVDEKGVQLARYVYQRWFQKSKPQTEQV